MSCVYLTFHNLRFDDNFLSFSRFVSIDSRACAWKIKTRTSTSKRDASIHMHTWRDWSNWAKCANTFQLRAFIISLFVCVRNFDRMLRAMQPYWPRAIPISPKQKCWLILLAYASLDWSFYAPKRCTIVCSERKRGQYIEYINVLRLVGCYSRLLFVLRTSFHQSLFLFSSVPFVSCYCVYTGISCVYFIGCSALPFSLSLPPGRLMLIVTVIGRMNWLRFDIDRLFSNKLKKVFFFRASHTLLTGPPHM